MERQEKSIDFNPIVTVGFVGHIPVDNLTELRRILSEVPELHIVFFKTTSGKLWLKEGDDDR